jgi:4-hydroxybenzoate polyprenyltransferase
MPQRQASEPAAALPLCVDLDGTLVRTDCLVETALAACRTPALLLRMPRWLAHGRAAFKAALARETSLSAELLPYNDELLEYLREQRRHGRRIVLATASDKRIADAVAAHLGIFDEVIASDGERNLKGTRKRDALVERFGHGGFVYAGNDYPDLAVWAAAGGAILVDTPPGVRSRVDGALVERTLESPYRRGAEALRALRPYQWVKNLLLFVPLLTANALYDTDAWLTLVLAFIGMSLAASGTYVLNDLLDLESDRRHPRKRNRAFARGALSPQTGLLLVPLLLGLGAAFAAASGTLALIAVYVALSLAYSMHFKERALVDVFLLGSLYCYRLFIGGYATGYLVSLWLLGYSAFLFLSLATMKRCAELVSRREHNGRRAYRREDLPFLLGMGLASSFASSIVLALYVQEQTRLEIYASPIVLWAIVPLLTFWQCRLWLATTRGAMTDDPILYAAKDFVSQLVGLGAFLCLFAAHLG